MDQAAKGIFQGLVCSQTRGGLVEKVNRQVIPDRGGGCIYMRVNQQQQHVGQAFSKADVFEDIQGQFPSVLRKDEQNIFSHTEYFLVVLVNEQQ